MDDKLILVKVLLQRMNDKDVKEVLTTLQQENVKERENTQREASESRPSSVSSGKRKSPSEESEQDHGDVPKKRRPLDVLAKLIATDTVIPVPRTKPIQGYVTKEQYYQLQDEYNRLQADYASLQQYLKLTLDCLDDPGADSDTYEEYNDSNQENNDLNEVKVEEDIEELQKVEYEDSSQALSKEKTNELNDQSPEECNGEVPEENNEEAQEGVMNEASVTQTEKDDEDQQDDCEDIIINTNSYVSSQQWVILVHTKAVKLFVKNVLRILFKKETLLESSVPGTQNKRSGESLQELDPKMIGVLKVLLEKYLDEKQEPPFTEVEKAEGRRDVMEYVSQYIAFLRQKHMEGVDITYL